MNRRWILVLLIACGVAGADANQDLEFAKKLGARGLDEMARQVLDDLIASGDPVKVRAGRYGKALLLKQEASLARNRFLRALEEGAQSPVSREEVLRLYTEAERPIEEYVQSQKEAIEPAFLLGELLQEHAEFLAGASYPDAEEFVETVAKLVEAHRDEAAKLFEKAIANYKRVIDPYVSGKKTMSDDPEDPTYVRVSLAEMQAGIALFRWALIYPKGANFTYKMDEAIETLDDFLQRHFEDLFGAYSMIYIGRGFYEKGARMGDVDELEIALGYFEQLIGQIDEQPSIPSTIDVLAEAFYWYNRTCNLIARGDGLKKPQPVYFDNTMASGSKLGQKLKYGSGHRFALLAMIEVADAYAAREDFDASVGIAGEVLAAARVAGQRRVGKIATSRLTQWVANVAGAGALEPGLLYQIGESLAAQGRTANAITFYEKAVASSSTDEMKEKWGYPSRLRIARVYRNDKRYFASSEVAWAVVDEFLATGQEEDTPFGQTASEACNTARLAWKSISGLTGRSADNSRYQSILKTFQEKFPGHPDNSDAAFGGALDVFNSGKYEIAADRLKDISPTSRNYWRAQRMVPVCYRRLATGSDDPAKTKEWNEKCLKSAEALVTLAGSKRDDTAAQRARQYGHLYIAMSLASLERWTDAITSMKDYLLRYPKDLLKHGLEYDILVHGYLATNALPLAEQTLVVMKQKIPGSSYISRCNFDVFDTLRNLYRAKGKADPQYKGIAARAARLWEERLGTVEKPKVSDLAIFGEVLAAAQEYEAAADAYEGAAKLEPSSKAKTGYTLRAAQNAFKAAKQKQNQGGSRKEYLAVIEKTRKLMTDVLIEKKDQQEALLKILGDYSKWPSRDQWKLIKRNAEVLLNAAEVYAESQMKGGVDGRMVAMRLIDHMHSFTIAITNADNPDDKLNEFVDEWWDGAQLKLELAVQISRDSGQKAKTVRSKALSYGKKLIFEYPDMDGPERVKQMQLLVDKLK